MSATATPLEAGRAIAACLERLSEISAEAGDRFRAAAWDAARHGELAAAQHLRNLLLAHATARSLAARPPCGLTPAHMPAVGALAEVLDRSLAADLAKAPGAAGGPARAGRILFVLDHLPAGGRIFSHARQVCAYAAALARIGGVERIGVLATQETAPENPIGALEVETGGQDAWRGELIAVDPEAAEVADKVAFFTPPRVGPVRPYRDSLARARGFDAEIIIAPQGVFRSRLLPTLLAPRAAVIALQMNATNAEPPFPDLVLAHGDGSGFALRQSPAKWRDHPVPMLPFAPLAAATGAGPEGSRLVLATVLTQGRLERGLLKDRAADLELVVSFLQETPGAQWRMIGLDDPDDFAARVGAASPDAAVLLGDRLKLIGVAPDPTAYFAKGGLYVHLPALGGGAMGAAMAIAAGMAALARAGGDIANLLPAGHLYKDAAQARLWLRRLAGDPDLRSRWNLAQKRTLARDHSIAAAARALAPVIEEARAIAEEKAAGAASGQAAGPHPSRRSRGDPPSP